MRKFEIVKDFAIEYNAKDVKLPIRSTQRSAGYDFFAPTKIILKANSSQKIFTNIKVKMDDDNAFVICNRSSFGPRGIIMPNAIGLIDADFYGNENNDGNMSFYLKNTTDEDMIFEKGDKIGQGFFINYLKTDDDCATGIRTGGFGTTGK